MEQNSAEAKKRMDRTYYFDCLRIIACFGVMILHIASKKWYGTPVTSFEWNVLNIYDSITRWVVPLFVMISGALFLNGKQSIEKLYKKYVLRIVTAFLFWSFLYAGVRFIGGCGMKEAVKAFLTGHYHLWFLFMIAGLYIIVPFLRKITESDTLIKYYLVLAFVFAFLLPQTVTILKLLSKSWGTLVNTMLSNVKFHFTLGFSCYFVLGYYLDRIELGKVARWILYLLGIAGFLFTAGMTAMLSISGGKPSDTFYGHFTVNILLESVAVFVFGKYHLKLAGAREKTLRLVRKLSKYSFGAYLVHVFIIERLQGQLGIDALTFSPLVSVPVIGIVVFVVSFLISAVLHRIPVLNKYIV